LREFRDKLFHLHAKDVEIFPHHLNEYGIFACPSDWHRPRIPGCGRIDWARFMAELTAVGYEGPVCIEVEDDTFGQTLAGRQRALKVARNVLRPYFA
jgi:sugar phosphate isomerase/epimerase